MMPSDRSDSPAVVMSQSTAQVAALSWRYWDDETNDCKQGATDLLLREVPVVVAELLSHLGEVCEHGERLSSLELTVEL